VYRYICTHVIFATLHHSGENNSDTYSQQMQRTATSVMQHTATSVMQHTATSVMQHTATSDKLDTYSQQMQHTATSVYTSSEYKSTAHTNNCYTLQHAATRCNTLQHAAPSMQPSGGYKIDTHSARHLSISHRTATNCNTLQHLRTPAASTCRTPIAQGSQASHSRQQHTATHRNSLQHTATHSKISIPQWRVRVGHPQRKTPKRRIPVHRASHAILIRNILCNPFGNITCGSIPPLHECEVPKTTADCENFSKSQLCGHFLQKNE